MPRGVSRYDEARLQGRLWVPPMLGGLLQMWVDGADISTITLDSSAGGSEWRDKSGRGRHCTQVTAVDRPVYNYIKRAFYAQQFSNAGWQITQVATGPWAASGNPYDMVCVGIRDSAASSYAVLVGGQSNDYPVIINGTGAISQFDGGFKAFGSLTWSTNEQAIAFLRLTSATDSEFAKNGDTLVADGGTSFATNTRPRVLGQDHNHFDSSTVTNAGFGWMQEFVFTDPLSAVQRQEVEGYLAWKWDDINGNNLLRSALPVTHRFRSRPPMIGD